MILSLSSIFSATISISILILIFYFMLAKIEVLTKLGATCIYLLLILILLRAFIPLEIPITKSFYFLNLFPVRQFFTNPLMEIRGISISLLTICYTVWGLGCVIHLWILFRNYRKARNEWTLYEEIIDGHDLFLFHQARKDVFGKSKRPVRLMRIPDKHTVLSAGLLHPIIFLPENDYTDEELYLAFYHELVHCKYWHNLFKFFIQIVIAIHWLNPFIRFFLKDCVNELLEFLVDSYVQKHTSRDKSFAYMNTILKSLHGTDRKIPSFSNGLIQFSKDKATTEVLIEKRFRYMLSKPQKKYSFFGMLLFTLLFVFSFTFVFEASSEPNFDEVGDSVYKDKEDETYYIKNGDSYDLYMQGEYVITVDEILDEFKDAPVYEKGEKP